MTRKSLAVTIVLVALLLACGGREATAQFVIFNPVDYAIGKVLDEFIVDPILVGVGWKPDVNKMQQRLMELEKNTALKSEVREEIRKLRESIKANATREELQALATDFRNNLKQITRRLDAAEDRLEMVEVKLEDKENNTKYSEDAGHFLGRGEKYLTESKEYFQALASARIASRLSPDKPEPYLLQGRVYTAMKAPEIARACFDQAIKVAPTYALGYRLRADLRLANRDVAGAVEDYGLAVKHDSKDGLAWARRGEARIALNQFADAVADCTEALKLDPKDTYARFQRGRAYTLGGEPGKAIADYDAYVAARPDDADGYDRRGYAYLKMGDLNKSLTDLEKTLKLDPDHGFGLMHMTELRNARGEYTNALEVGGRAVERNPNHFYPHFEYALALKMLGKEEEALKHFKESASRNPGNANNYQVRAYANCGIIYFNTDDDANAIQYLSLALAIKPEQTTKDGTPLLTFRARSYNAKREYARAIEDATAALKIKPDDVNALFTRGYARSERNEYADAIADYTEVIRLAPTDAGAYNNRGDLYRRRGGKGDAAKALKDFTEAIKIDPKHEYAHYNRGLVNRSLSKYSDAADDFAKALRSPDEGIQEDAIANLIEISPDNAELLKALPGGSNAFGTYSGLKKRIYVPDDEKSYGSYNNYGYSTTSSYAGYTGIPSGYWVYVAPYWYIWGSK